MLTSALLSQLDNGYILFSGVRVPRTSLLSRYTQVDAAGHVDRSPLQQLAYGALVYGRVVAVVSSAAQHAAALTIAVRYLLVRRQFAEAGSPASRAGDAAEAPAGEFPRALPAVPVAPERPILDYAIQQRRLIPLLAGALAVHAAGRVLQNMYDRTQSAVRAALGGEGGGGAIAPAIARLKELHGWSAGLKAWATWHAHGAIDEARQACGGHGYSGYSGLPGLLAEHAVCVTWEGDNTVMSLQCARFLLSAARTGAAAEEATMPDDGHPASLASLRAEAHGAGRAASGSLLSPLQSGDGPTALEERATSLPLVVAGIVRRLAHRQLLEVAAQVAAPGGSFEASGHALSAAAQSCCAAFAAHALAGLAAAATAASLGAPDAPVGGLLRGVWGVCSDAPMSAETAAVLRRLSAAFSLTVLEGRLGHAGGSVSGTDATGLRAALQRLCAALRPDALAVVEAWDFDDALLRSEIGRRDVRCRGIACAAPVPSPWLPFFLWHGCRVTSTGTTCGE